MPAFNHLWVLSRNRRRTANGIAAYFMYRRLRDRRSCWMHDMNRARAIDGEFARLTLKHLRNHDDRFFNMYRMHIKQFDELLQMLMPDLQKMTTNYREPVSAEERLILTLT